MNGGSNGLSLAWLYDRYGNRLQQTASGTGTAPQPNYQVNAANNQISTYSYDAAGEVTSDGTTGYSYDAEGNTMATGTTRYNFDALGNRIEKLPNSGDPTWYVYDAFGHQLEVVDGKTNALQQTRLTVNGQPLAFYTNGSLEFQHKDWLGTVRALSNASGSFVATYHSLPFGDGYSFSGSDPDTGHYADLERDSSTNTDHAMARNFGEAAGRWMSPDPYDGSYDTLNPQSLNRYSYVLNNPIGFTDPSGLETTCSVGQDDSGNVFVSCGDDGGGGGRRRRRRQPSPRPQSMRLGLLSGQWPQLAYTKPA